MNGDDKKNGKNDFKTSSGLVLPTPRHAQIDTFKTSTGLELPTPSGGDQFQTSSGKKLPRPKEINNERFQTSSGLSLPTPPIDTENGQVVKMGTLPAQASSEAPPRRGGGSKPSDADFRYQLRRNKQMRDIENEIDRLSVEAGKARKKAENNLKGIQGVDGTMYIPDPAYKNEEVQLIAERRKREDQLDKLEQQALDEQDTGQGAFSSGFSSFVRGVAEPLSEDLLKGFGIAGTGIAKMIGNAQGQNTDNYNPEDHPFFKWGEQVGDAIRETFPENPKFQKDFLVRTLPQAFGSGLSFAAGGVAGEGSAALLGSVSMASNEFENALDKTGDLDKAFDTFLFNLPIGATEAIPVGSMFRRLDNSTGGLVKKGLKEAIKETPELFGKQALKSTAKQTAKQVGKDAAIGGVEELTQESFQTGLQNWTASEIYDKTRGIFDGVGQGGAAGFITGAFLNGAGRAIRNELNNAEGRRAEELNKAESFINELQHKAVGAQSISSEGQQDGETEIDQPIEFSYDPNETADNQVQTLLSESQKLKQQRSGAEDGTQRADDLDVAIEQVQTLIDQKREELSVDQNSKDKAKPQEQPTKTKDTEVSTAETLGTRVNEQGIQGEPKFRNGLSIAARNPDGKVFAGGNSHAELINENDTDIDIGQSQMGFLTQDGRFLNRKEAAEFVGDKGGKIAPRPTTQQTDSTPRKKLQAQNSTDDQAIATMRKANLPEAAISHAQNPDVLTDENGAPPQTGEPVTVEAYQGTGRQEQSTVYNEGADGPILGDADYFALDANSAREFGPTVNRREVSLDNPVVIDSDQKLAEWMTGNPNGSVPTSNEQRSELINDFRNRVEEAGHDGAIINVPSMMDANTKGESVKRLREVFGNSQIVKFPSQNDTQQQQRPVGNRLFGEDLDNITVTEQDVMDGKYNVRRDRDGFTVKNQETGESVGRQSNNYNEAVAESIVRDTENNSDFLDDSNIKNEQDYLNRVASESNNPLELAEAFDLARTIDNINNENANQSILQRFFDEGGRVRPQDIAEYGDPVYLTDDNRLRLFTNDDAVPLDIRAEILSNKSGQEITPDDIIDHLEREVLSASKQSDRRSSIRERFKELTDVNLTDKLADAILEKQFEEFTDEQGEVLPDIGLLLSDYTGPQGEIDYNKLWKQGLSEDQLQDLFTGDNNLLTQKNYLELKNEVRNEINRSKQEAKERAGKPEEASEQDTQQETADPKSAEYGNQNQIIGPERADRARQELRSKLGGQFNSGIDPSATKQMMELALFHLEAGSRKFGQFASAMISDIGQNVKPYLRALYKQAKFRSNIEDAEFSNDAEIISWEQENLSENNLINSIDREFRNNLAKQDVQGYKSAGRPELANPVNDDQAREAVDFVDEQRKQEGKPSPRSDKVVSQEAKRRLETDYEGEKARLFDMVQDFNGGLWSDVDVKMAKIIMARESQQAISSDNKADLFNFFLMTGVYRQAGTEQARAFRMRRDDSKSPEERRAEMIKDVFNDSKQAVDIAVLIHRLAEQAMRGELNEQEFREAVREKMNEYRSQREQQKSSIQTGLEKLTGKRLTDSEINDIYEASQNGEQAVQDAINENASKMNLPPITVAQLMQLESHIENVENAPVGPRRNQALLELMEFIEDSGIVGGKFSRGLRKAVDDILGREHDLFDSTDDIIESVRNRVMENVTQALLTPPKEVQQQMDEAPDHQSRQKIWDDYYQRFQAIKQALKKENGIDIENLSNEDIQDPVLMNDILRKFQAANANFDSKFYEYWNNAILSAIGTHAVNIAGTSANLFYKSVPLRFSEAFVNTFAREPGSAQWGEFKYFWKGFFTHIPEAIKYATLAFQTETRLFAEEIGVERGVGKFQDKMKTGVAIKGKLGRFVRMFGWRPLTMMDEFHKVVGFRMQMSAEAYREAVRRGMKGEEIAEFIEAQQQNPTGQIAEAAWGWALEVAFQEETGAVTSAFADLRQKHELVKYALPFVRTPGNLLKQGTRKGPLGALNIIHRATMAGAYKMGLSKKSKWEYSRSEVTQHMAEQFTFWTAIIGTGMLASALQGDDDDDPRPLITGSGASYKDQSAYRYQQQNYPPQSVRIPGTDRYYSYRRLDPFATMITNTVDAMDAIQHLQEGKEVMDVTNTFFKKNLRNIQNKSYFQFFGDLQRFMDYPSSGLNWIGNFTASWMPNIIRHQIRAGDNYVREYSKGKSADTFSGVAENVVQKTVKKALPLSTNQPPPRVDWLGFPVKKDLWGGAKQAYLYRILPSQTVNNKPMAYDELIMHWNNQNPNEVWFPTVPNDKITIDGERVQLDKEQYYDYVQRRGFHTQRLLDEQYYKLDIEFPSQEDIDIIQSAQRKAAKIARKNMLNEGIILPPLKDK